LSFSCRPGDDDSGLPGVFTLTEATVADMQQARNTGLLSVERLVGLTSPASPPSTLKGRG
jgi:hypothetical protein